jgi:hypothetical protein
VGRQIPLATGKLPNISGKTLHCQTALGIRADYWERSGVARFYTTACFLLKQPDKQMLPSAPAGVFWTRKPRLLHSLRFSLGVGSALDTLRSGLRRKVAVFSFAKTPLARHAIAQRESQTPKGVFAESARYRNSCIDLFLIVVLFIEWSVVRVFPHYFLRWTSAQTGLPPAGQYYFSSILTGTLRNTRLKSSWAKSTDSSIALLVGITRTLTCLSRAKRNRH